MRGGAANPAAPDWDIGGDSDGSALEMVRKGGVLTPDPPSR